MNLAASQTCSTRHVYRLSRSDTRNDTVPAVAAFRVGGQIGGQALQGMHRWVLSACQFLSRQLSAVYSALPPAAGTTHVSVWLPNMSDISTSLQTHQILMPAAGTTHCQMPTCSMSRTLLPACSFPSTSLGSEQLLDSHAETSDTDAFPSSSSHTSAADWKDKSAPANKAKGLSQNSKQGNAAHITQQPHDPSSHALPGAAASAVSNLTDAAASAASKAADSNTNWASAFKDQLTAASDKITSGFQLATVNASSTLSVASGKVASGLQLAASNVTATLASKASGVAAKARTTAQGQSTHEIHSTAKEQLTAKQQSKPKGQNTVKSPASKKGSAGPVVFPWDVKMAKQTVCNDTCHKAVSAFQSCL